MVKLYYELSRAIGIDKHFSSKFVNQRESEWVCVMDDEKETS